jgi:hypothetical protein
MKWIASDIADVTLPIAKFLAFLRHNNLEDSG